ncbi:hypothetical protein OHB00_01190 [Streptomyces sp. NBC_00631]|uniref:hypothetical protein n=1 Tax=Streptomyces sp. NBC_00631 TaxID=2975793 RepID=UPI0030E193E8
MSTRATQSRPHGTGRVLVGTRERTTLYQGGFTAVPGTDGGRTVRALLVPSFRHGPPPRVTSDTAVGQGLQRLAFTMGVHVGVLATVV